MGCAPQTRRSLGAHRQSPWRGPLSVHHAGAGRPARSALLRAEPQVGAGKGRRVVVADLWVGVEYTDYTAAVPVTSIPAAEFDRILATLSGPNADAAARYP